TRLSSSLPQLIVVLHAKGERFPHLEMSRKTCFVFCALFAAALILARLYVLDLNEPSVRTYSTLATVIPAPSRPTNLDDMFDFNRCNNEMTLFVTKSDHPLSQALSKHPAAIEDDHSACLHIVVTHNDDFTSPEQWGLADDGSLNIVVVNLSPQSPYTSSGKELVVQPHFVRGEFRPLVDFALVTNVRKLNKSAWQNRPQILPFVRENLFVIVGDLSTRINSVKYVACEGLCDKQLSDATFCLLEPNVYFQYELLSSIRVGCIPIVHSLTQPLPFQEMLDWRRVAFRFPKRRPIHTILEVVERVEKEEILEMRRMCRVFANRMENSDALAETLIAALAERMQLVLPNMTNKESHSTAIIPAVENVQFTRVPSQFKTTLAFGTYSYSRWNSGRRLRYAPTTMFDTPMLPNGAHYDNDTMVTMESAIGSSSESSFSQAIGLTRDVEQFTVIILTYDRDESLVTVLNLLNNCPYLNKVIIVWNNLDRAPPDDIWPTIHVPIEFIFPKVNSLLSRFVPYEAIETEAVVSLDDDQDLSHSEIVFAFRVWRENRDRLIGFPARHTYMEAGQGQYGLGGYCEYSLILTGFAIMHKEFLFEFTYNQHPLIREHIDRNMNCEDIAMNFLVAHLSRKPPIKIIKYTDTENPQGKKKGGGISSKPTHYSIRSNCVQLFSEIYGYNPLLQSQHQAVPTIGGCMKGM
ncbi:hypothetical protein PFISCL1PPCAC_22221, partial [Pristionchus fissidentatus]